MPRIETERERRPLLLAGDANLFFRGLAQLIDASHFRPAIQRRGPQLLERALFAGRRQRRRGDFDVRQQLAIQQEVEEAARLAREILGLALLLLDCEQLGLRAQHLVFGDLAVREQRFVDAQVLAQQLAAGGDDLDRAAGFEPIDIGNRDVAAQSARDGHAVEAARVEERALRAHGRGNRRCVERLTHDYARVLLFLAEELHRDVGNLGELRRLALRGEQVVQRGVDGIERRADRDRELASAFGARVTGLQRNFGKEPRSGCCERLRGPLDFERLALQGEVTAQALGYVALDHRIEFAFARPLGERGERYSEADAAEDQVAHHDRTLRRRRR